MRKQYQAILRKVFNEELIHVRNDLSLTQEEMASLLSMDPRSYIELDHGKSGCSAVTLSLFLTVVAKEPEDFLSKLREEFESAC